ncbi:MAG: formimidoylglutamase [Microscillaceae bacterium]
MNLADFFLPVGPSVFSQPLETSQWGQYIQIFRNRFPAWKRKHLALLGLPNASSGQYPADSVRQQLYQFQKGKGAYLIVDLGNLKAQDSEEATQEVLRQVCEALLQHQVVPLIVGGSHAHDYAQYMAFARQASKMNLVCVDARIDVSSSELLPPSERHLRQILTQKPSHLFNFHHLGHQPHLNHTSAREMLGAFYYEAYSAGQIRQDIAEMEPVLRQAHMLSIDLRAVRMQDAPAHPQASLLGLSAEEICQLCWFAGQNEEMASLGIYELHPEWDERHKTASLVALMLWYFTEGYYQRVRVKDFHSQAFMKYVVSDLDHPSQMVFYKHRATQKWWMEVPYPPREGNTPAEAMIVPCSYRDYQAAGQGEVPDRWINTYAKLP